MWILGVVLYLSIGFLFYSYQEYVYKNVALQKDVSQFERKTFESDHTPSIFKTVAFWPLEITAWGIVWLAYISR